MLFKRRRILNSIILIFLVAALAVAALAAAALAVAPAVSARAYSADVPSEWALEEVLKAKEYGLIPAGMYHSFTSDIIRSDFCRLVMALYTKITGEPEKFPLPSAFSDTENISVLNAYELGIVKGVGGGYFLPGRPITRQEIAVMLYNAINAINVSTGKDILNSDSSVLMFSDQDQTDDWAVEAIKSLRQNDIMLGDGKNCFNPLDNTTKEMAFILVNRIYLIYSGLDAKKSFPTAYTGEILMRIKGSFISADEYQIVGDVYELYPDISIAALNGYLDGEAFVDNDGTVYHINRSESLSESVGAGYAGGIYYPVYVLLREGAQPDRLYLLADGSQYRLYMDLERKVPYLLKTFSDVLFGVPADTIVVFDDPDGGSDGVNNGAKSNADGTITGETSAVTAPAGGTGTVDTTKSDALITGTPVGNRLINAKAASETTNGTDIIESGDEKVPAGYVLMFSDIHRDSPELLDMFLWRVRLAMGKVTHMAAMPY